MDFDPHLMLEGIAITCYACRLDKAYFFIRGEYHHQATSMREGPQGGLRERHLRRQGLIGSSGANTGGALPRRLLRAPRRRARTSAARRPACSKRSRASAAGPASSRPSRRSRACSASRRSSTTSRPSPRARHHRPTARTGSPTRACESSIGGPPSYGTKLMGVSGHVERPGVYECELGIPLRTLVEDFCGGMRGGKKYKGAIAGGVSMGILGRTSTTPRWISTSGASTTCWASAPRARRSSTRTPTWSRSRATSPASSSTRAAGSAPPAARARVAVPAALPHRRGRRHAPRIWTSLLEIATSMGSCPARRSAASPTATTGRCGRS
jgi:hypothetical protein